MRRRKILAGYRRAQQNRGRDINKLHALFLAQGITDKVPGRAHYINPKSKKGDKLSVTNTCLGGEYGKHKIAAFDGVFRQH